MRHRSGIITSPLSCCVVVVAMTVVVVSTVLRPSGAFETCRRGVVVVRTTSGRRDALRAAGAGGDGDNPAMAFLRRKGRVGGAANKDFVNAMGVDEGPVGKNPAESGVVGGRPIRKARSAYAECSSSGVVDDLSEPFPVTSSGTQWSGVTDHVMGGMSSGSLTRETNLCGRTANVLRGRVSLANNGGFVQMATDLALRPDKQNSVDASAYDGVELDALTTPRNDDDDDHDGYDTFNVHLRNEACARRFSSYRASFRTRNVDDDDDDDAPRWTTVRLPWSSFVGHGPGADETPFDPTTLRRIGLVAIGKEADVYLAVSGVRFYRANGGKE